MGVVHRRVSWQGMSTRGDDRTLIFSRHTLQDGSLHVPTNGRPGFHSVWNGPGPGTAALAREVKIPEGAERPSARYMPA